MRFLKRICIYLFVLLFILSIHTDLTTGIIIKSEGTNIESLESTNVPSVKIQVHPGDTVLSIVEQINENNETQSMNISQIVEDFKKINPDADPYQLKPFQYYHFPLYHNIT